MAVNDDEGFIQKWENSGEQHARSNDPELHIGFTDRWNLYFQMGTSLEVLVFDKKLDKEHPK